jgi:hypothetical protein
MTPKVFDGYGPMNALRVGDVVLLRRNYHGKKAYAVQFLTSATAGDELHLVFSGAGGESGTFYELEDGYSDVEVSIWYAGSWTTQTISTSGAGSNLFSFPLASFSTPIPSSVNASYMSVRLIPRGGGFPTPAVTVSLAMRTSPNKSVGVTFLNVPEHLQVKSFSDGVNLKLTSREACNTVSARLRFAGDPLFGGGIIGHAHLDGGVSASEAESGDWFNALAKIATQAGTKPLYSGDGDCGSYAVAPQVSQNAILFYPHGTSALSDEIWLNRPFVVKYLSSTHAGQTSYLTECQLNEWASRYQLFQGFVAPFIPGWNAVAYAMVRAMKVMCNPKHQNILQRGWAAFKDWIKKPSTWSTIARVGMTVAPLLV